MTYIILGLIMPAFNSITSDTLVSFNATANMTNFPGTYEAVASSPVWIWFIPGIVGVVTTAVMLKRG